MYRETQFEKRETIAERKTLIKKLLGRKLGVKIILGGDQSKPGACSITSYKGL
ncbi:hypothetical protein SESBI_45245 [Sesbania bispinosa]|nr:hypothetical protein SESBI_45245 [Sesbania bispinosa]